MRTVLFVPGGGEDMDSRGYDAVLSMLEARGYKAIFVPIVWKRTTIDSWVAELTEVYSRYDPKQTVLAGFSWGAMTAFVTAAKRPPAALWLCSLSPFFRDDQFIVAMNPVHSIMREIGIRRHRDFAKLNFSELAQQVTSPTVIFVGEFDGGKFPYLKQRCEIASRKIANAKLVSVPGAGHEIDHPNYIAAIQQNI